MQALQLQILAWLPTEMDALIRTCHDELQNSPLTGSSRRHVLAFSESYF